MSDKLFEALVNVYGNEPRVLTKAEIRQVAIDNGIKSTQSLLKTMGRVSRGKYQFPPSSGNNVVPIPKPTEASTLTSTGDNGFTDNLIPQADDLFVPFGNYKMVRDVIKSRMFYPMFVTGLSGNGKTQMVLQACAETKREVIRVNFTIETDEDDLIGGFRLVNGETKFFKGPVIKAMGRGAVLLCDEIDLANPAKVMCLQSILEGSGYFIKKTGEYIAPAPGFTVISTANTKGKGSENGQFIGTNIMNEAFLERFPITCEQSYPTVTVERKILDRVFASVGKTADSDLEFAQKLVDWADIIRKTYYDGGVDEIISTRRLVHIVRAYAIFGKRDRAIELCINRFDDEIKDAFFSLYEKIDADVAGASEENSDNDFTSDSTSVEY